MTKTNAEKAAEATLRAIKGIEKKASRRRSRGNGTGYLGEVKPQDFWDEWELPEPITFNRRGKNWKVHKWVSP